MKQKTTKIFYLTTAGHLAGTERQLLYLAEAMNKKDGYEIVAGTIMAEGSDPLLKELRERGVKTYSLGLEKKYELWKIFKLYKILKQEKPDILQSFLYLDNIVARMVGKLARLRQGFGGQAGVPVVISGMRNANSYRKPMRKLFDKLTVPLADCIVSNNYAGKEILLDELGGEASDKIKVIRNGIKLTNDKLQMTNSRSSVMSHKSYVRVGFVGYLTKQKGVKYLLDAAAIVSRKQQNVRFVIIGDGPERAALETRAQRLGIANNVHFAGHMENASAYIGNFNIFVLPSLWEGMPNVLMEAMLREVPVVASAVGDVPSLVENEKTGFLTEPGNAKDLAGKIEYVLQLEEEQKRKITEKARKKIESEFTIKNMVQKYEKLYKSVTRLPAGRQVTSNS